MLAEIFWRDGQDLREDFASSPEGKLSELIAPGDAIPDRLGLGLLFLPEGVEESLQAKGSLYVIQDPWGSS